MYNESTWKEGEKLAQKYMKKHGYKIIYTNFKIAGVELDIVATLSVRAQYKRLKLELKEKLKLEKNRKKRQILLKNLSNFKKSLKKLIVVTEVKARSSDEFGMGVEAVDRQKENHIKRGAEILCKKRAFRNMQLRMDIASVDSGVVTYFENAIYCRR